MKQKLTRYDIYEIVKAEVQTASGEIDLTPSSVLNFINLDSLDELEILINIEKSIGIKLEPIDGMMNLTVTELTDKVWEQYLGYEKHES